MIKVNLFPGKQFNTKKDLFDHIKANLESIIESKKSSEQKAYEKNISITCKVLNGIKLNVAEKAIEIDNDYWYIAVNSTMILDSHWDLHVDGLWDASIVDDQGKNYLVADHELKLANTIVKKEHIEMFVAKVSFASIGFPYPGNTQVLVYKFRKDKVIHEVAAKWLESGDEIQASVRMMYGVIEFALDSNDPDDKEWKKRYDKYIDKIANKAELEYIPYFFVIKEAKNVRESSLVIFGSNHVTGNIIQQKDIEESGEDIQKQAADKPKSDKAKSNFYSLIH